MVPQRALMPGKAGPALMRQSVSSSAVTAGAEPINNNAVNKALLLRGMDIRVVVKAALSWRCNFLM
jgi:hypothetical protein